MLLLVQWARDVSTDWIEVDVADFSTLAKRPAPVGGEPLTTNGYIGAINILGEVWEGFDGYHVQQSGDGIQVTAWIAGDLVRRAIYLPPVAQAEMGGAISNVAPHEVWSIPLRTNNSRTAVTVVADLAPYIPPDSADLRFGVYVVAGEAARTEQGWRAARWHEHHADEVDAEGRLLCQRIQGRYVPLENTRTYFQRTTARSNPAFSADREDALENIIGAASSVSINVKNSNDDSVIWLFTTPASEPGSAAWPTGIYRAQLDVTSVHVNLVFGLKNGEAGFHRMNAALDTSLEYKPQSETEFSGTGLHLATYTGSWSSGSSSDRLAIAIWAKRMSTPPNSQPITLELNELDDFVDGDWPGGGAAAALGILAEVVTIVELVTADVELAPPVLSNNVEIV